MKIAISTDEYSPLIDVLLSELKQKGHETVYFGPLKDEKSQDWPDVTLKAIEQVQSGAADEAIVLCWTGTGCTLIASKVPGIRAALCVDAETAKGARTWNHANVLGLSLRLTSSEALKEILTAWFETPYSTDEWNLQQMKRIKETEARYQGL
ncbi:MAG: RpiB/LacA/LacB family sugar-phosphate isomerase [Rhabdochlamydiaceae bacterium]|jgi:ribose 5-phosphate isomerase B